MMKSKVFSLALLLFSSFSAFAQYKLSGKVISSTDSLPVINCSVFLSDKSSAVTNAQGEFTFLNKPSGNYTLSVACIGYKRRNSQIKLNEDKVVVINLSQDTRALSEVVVKTRKNDFGFSHLKAVENLGIYEGKKSEVIVPDELVANLSTNNARQIYSRVAGLNIWENDGAGLQLSIGGRGLDPNRSSNFNVRQNGYDISADALGYPESYYTPPAEAIGQIQIVRGAASLQYGTQFGGLINFIMKKPVSDKKFELTARQSMGSYNFYNAFTSASGTVNKLSYYAYFQYKTGDGFRGNSDFDSHGAYGNLNYQFSENTKLGVDITHMDYLAHQPGGLTDNMFETDPTQSNRERNWFKVNWNLYALHFDHKFNSKNEVNLRAFALSALRNSVGFRVNRVESADDNSERDLIKGNFENWGLEARYLKRYAVKNINSVFLVGTRYYHGFNHSIQGFGTTGKNADFNYIDKDNLILNDFRFPNRNVALFAENIFWITPKLSVIPGIRYEYINTKAEGFWASRRPSLDPSQIELGSREYEPRQKKRDFILAGIGLSYKPKGSINLYGNISQNYRSITFSDIRTSNPSSEIDPNITDEKGYSADIGIRNDASRILNYDVSVFYLNYGNRIGERQAAAANDPLKAVMRRENIGKAVIVGVESYIETNVLQFFSTPPQNWMCSVFANTAFIKSEYKKSDAPGVQGNQVEFVPDLNIKTGFRIGYKKLMGSFQCTYLSEQFTDAGNDYIDANSTRNSTTGIIGQIPAYTIMDAGLSYQFKRFKLEGNVNNLANAYYFTRRATGYPGPGIIPSDNRTFYLTLQVKI